jgi:hypothetical protein
MCLIAGRSVCCPLLLFYVSLVLYANTVRMAALHYWTSTYMPDLLCGRVRQEWSPCTSENPAECFPLLAKHHMIGACGAGIWVEARCETGGVGGEPHLGGYWQRVSMGCVPAFSALSYAGLQAGREGSI